MIIKDLRGIESTQDACAKIRVGFMKTIHECKRLWFDKVLYFFETFCFIVLLQKSKDSRKGPVVILSITYRGVKFIDAATKVIDTSLCVRVCLCVWGKGDGGGLLIRRTQSLPLIYSVCIAKHLIVVRQTIVAEHEIRNISCAAQDPDDLCTFAYITKDLKSGHHFCHVFSTVEVVSEIYVFIYLPIK